MPELVTRGIDCRLYAAGTSGTWGSPAFAEVKNAGDVKIPSNPEMSDITTRGGRGLKQEATALIGLQLECKLIRKIGDANWDRVKQAFITGGQILMAEATGDLDSAGVNTAADVLWIWANVSKFEETHENGQVVSAEVTFSPGEGDSSGNVWQYTPAA